MDRIERQIVGILALHPEGRAAQELQKSIRPKVSQPTLWRRIDSLRATGRIRAIGQGRATRYVNAGSDHSIADLRSKALHVEIGHKLIRRPELLDDARKRLERMLESAPYASEYLYRWNELLSGPIENILRTLGADDDESTALRHVSPFAGVLSEKERISVLRKQRLFR